MYEDLFYKRLAELNANTSVSHLRNFLRMETGIPVNTRKFCPT